ncbi:MAG: Quinone oxidoreductase 1 [Pseudomonadota bacterium]
MQVVRIHQPGGPEALCIEQLPLPIPGPGEVRVKAHAVGVGRPDVLIRQGTYKWMPPLPAIPGAELAGVVDVVGEQVTSLKVGQRVLVSSRDLAQRGGCYVESIVVPEGAPYILPDAISFNDAVSLPNLQLALALMQAASPGHAPMPGTVLITGAAGGVATMLSQVARHHGFKTIGTARSEDKKKFALSNGFDVILDANPETLVEQVMSATGNQGVNLVYDHLGGAIFPACIRSLSPLGLAISYNIITGKPDADVFGVLRELLGKSLGVRCFSMHTFDEDKNNRRSMMKNAIELMSNGHVRSPSALIMDFSQVAQAHEILDQGLTLGKIVLKPH